MKSNELIAKVFPNVPSVISLITDKYKFIQESESYRYTAYYVFSLLFAGRLSGSRVSYKGFDLEAALTCRYIIYFTILLGLVTKRNRFIHKIQLVTDEI